MPYWTAACPHKDSKDCPGNHTPSPGRFNGRAGELVLTAGGFHQHAGTLVAYFGQFEYDPDCLIDGHRPRDPGRHLPQ